MNDVAAAPVFAPRYRVEPGRNFTTASFGQTPSQTVGPYLHIGLPWPDGPNVVPDDTDGALTVTISVTIVDGNRTPLADAMIETWQADAAGRFDHPDDPRGATPSTPPGFRGFGRAIADSSGTATIRTVKPGALPAEDNRTEAPHIDLAIFARGLLDRLVTRIYFPDEPDANAVDPVLAGLDAQQRRKLTARPTPTGYHLDVVIQDMNPDGDETPFFEL
ncbi:protocatechuate 3,4-dioxygenase subunit alpha [Rhodococcus sp. 06-156-3C]|uniref:protocatechuate 3,4-dioxygenase subunit alpha n=1 Tax=Nocardiaceae TaxID=85025 RepID=UPI000522F547|nr:MULTISPECIES: protocatechuate 3,4-dioxygenase subunit alpha [Rhodococcus]OZD18234.1 protocatechuate 3,4-dioxygenase subunit alpha [Rhodococcus sp. 06-156-4C]OZD18832.1 protocatechuate 3,4-dioxygenase subunit alpha [Rhodococcus sp. 06-156-3C]OZD22342.1 protocatechuate 3,4-dioxygenase subunit alpha [Rhodococcus sp. 06-156-4a]OZD33926.1 protocatechuate 3,4-dioxygenase subunit alpha [Rhodococcus sp. 06-156-3b]OZD38663.1 protocatechuate 3,4-dioxygenase subunit alpha [Rhodococcus sp. 06-156-3]